MALLSSIAMKAWFFPFEYYPILNSRIADAGTVVTVFMAILTGTFSLVILGPEVQGRRTVSHAVF
jgi:hypothetical protein